MFEISEETDTRTFDEWLRDYVQDAEAVLTISSTMETSVDRCAYRAGLLDAAREILERREGTRPQPSSERDR